MLAAICFRRKLEKFFIFSVRFHDRRDNEKWWFELQMGRIDLKKEQQNQFEEQNLAIGAKKIVFYG